MYNMYISIHVYRYIHICYVKCKMVVSTQLTCSHDRPALGPHLFFAMIGRQRWVMAKLPRLDAGSNIMDKSWIMSTPD